MLLCIQNKIKEFNKINKAVFFHIHGTAHP